MEQLTDWAQVVAATAAVVGVTIGWILARQANKEAEDRFARAQKEEHTRLSELLADEHRRAEAVRRSENERFETAARHTFDLQRLPIIVEAQSRVTGAVQDLDDCAEELVVAWNRGESTDGATAREEIVASTRRARRELNRFHQICALGWVSAAADYYTLALHNGIVSIEQNLVPEVFDNGGEIPLRDPFGMLTIIWPDADAPPPGVPSLTEVLAENGALHQLNTVWAQDDAMATLVALHRILETWEQSVTDTLVDVHGTPLQASEYEPVEVTHEQRKLLTRAASAFEHFAWQYTDALRTKAARAGDAPTKWPEFRQVEREDLVEASRAAADALRKVQQAADLDERAHSLVDVAAHSVKWATSAEQEQVSESGTLRLVEAWPRQVPSQYAVRPETDNHGMAVLARTPSVGTYLRLAAAMKLVADRLSALAANTSVAREDARMSHFAGAASG